MGSLRKESRMLVAQEQENHHSPIKVYGGSSKQASKMLAKASSMVVDATDSLRGLQPSSQGKSPIKKQASESPQKNVADLARSSAQKKTDSSASTTLSSSSIGSSLNALYDQNSKKMFGGPSGMSTLRASNLLKSRKTCEEREINITDIVVVEQKIVTFGQYISGQSLGNEIYIYNKTSNEQTFTLSIDKTSDEFPETVKELLAPYCPQDLPFEPDDESQAVNSQRKYNCWSIEDPLSKTLQPSIMFKVAPRENKRIIVVLMSPMQATSSNMLAKVVLNHLTTSNLMQSGSNQIRSAIANTFVEKRIGSYSTGFDSQDIVDV